jgi:hypothetical protein
MLRIFMRLFVSASSLVWLCQPVLATKYPISLYGIISNAANPSKPITTTMTLSVDSAGTCIVRVDAPLYGSGPCKILESEGTEGLVTVVSTGPSALITWTGTLSDAGYQGTYAISYPDFPQLPEGGTFRLVCNTVPVILRLQDVLESIDFTAKDGTLCHIVADRDMAYFLNPKYEYSGIRLRLDDKQEPVVRIEDHKDGSLYIDARTNKPFIEWHTDGKDGYFSQSSGNVMVYYDRFMNDTPWSSVAVNGSTIYLKEAGEAVELYDSAFKPLNISYGKTSTGRVYWTSTDADGLTEYFDDHMKPLTWFSAKRDGQTYYAHVVGKKVKVFDSSLHPVQPKRTFWSNFGRGLATGLVVYGQALHEQAAANPRRSGSTTDPSYSTSTQTNGGSSYSNTTTSNGGNYTTPTQSIGNMDYRTTTGPNGYQATTTTQHIGNFDYVNGSSSAGLIQGMRQQIGSFNYSSYTTEPGQWNATSQQIGNFTYHTITSPDGSVHTGTSQRIGDFLYTAIH